MRAVILAAGRGGRLGGVTGDRPKCLARVGDRSLLERQIRSLSEGGITAVTVVAGYQAAAVRRVCGADVTLIDNTQYSSTNSLYSLWLARDVLRDGFVVLNCDVLFHPQLLRDLLTARLEDALLVAPRTDDDAYGDEEMKVQVRRGRVVGISKALALDDADGENVGIAKFGADGAAILIEELDRLVAAGARREWLPAAFAAFSRRRALYAIPTRGFPWIEIDFPEDYWRACTEVLPAIDEHDSARLAAPPVARGAAAGHVGRTVRHV
jgi:choline kinase